MARRPHVIIIGSGFGGLFAARAFAEKHVDVTLISKTAQHLFQPLLYQVATGILSEGEIAPTTREVLRRQKNVQVHLGEVCRIDLEARTVHYEMLDKRMVLAYDYLIVSAGSSQSYFGNDEFARHAPGMKSIDDALEIRGRIFGAFERAEVSADPSDVARLTTFVVVGAGPTGVEMAGQIAELAYRALPDEFHNFDTRSSRVILLDAADQVLGSFGDRLSGKAQRALERLGVDVRLGQKVVDVDARGIVVELSDGTRERIEAFTKVWAAGVQASPLGKQLGEQSGAAVDRSGRVAVQPDLSLPGHPEVFVVGDMMALDHLPGVSPVAIQGGRHAARLIVARAQDPDFTEPFQYFDKGSMATISRFSGVAQVRDFRTAGFIAWVLWLGVHLWYLIGFKHRLTTLLHWTVSFIGRGRAERAVTTQQVIARRAIEDHGPGYNPLTDSD